MAARKKVVQSNPSRLRNAFDVVFECGHSEVLYGVGKITKQPPKTGTCRICKSTNEAAQ